jgi:hypothetical protein
MTTKRSQNRVAMEYTAYSSQLYTPIFRPHFSCSKTNSIIDQTKDDCQKRYRQRTDWDGTVIVGINDFVHSFLPERKTVNFFDRPTTSVSAWFVPVQGTALF